MSWIIVVRPCLLKIRFSVSTEKVLLLLLLLLLNIILHSEAQTFRKEKKKNVLFFFHFNHMWLSRTTSICWILSAIHPQWCWLEHHKGLNVLTLIKHYEVKSLWWAFHPIRLPDAQFCATPLDILKDSWGCFQVFVFFFWWSKLGYFSLEDHLHLCLWRGNQFF